MRSIRFHTRHHRYICPDGNVLYRIRNVNHSSVITQTPHHSMLYVPFVKHLCIPTVDGQLQWHMRIGSRYFCRHSNSAPVYVMCVYAYSIHRQLTAYEKKRITTIRMRNKQLARAEIVWKKCNACLTVFLCLNEPNENKGEAACRMLNSHAESCYSMHITEFFGVS